MSDPSFRSIAGFFALSLLTKPTVELMAAAPEKASRYFEAFRAAVENVMREHPHMAKFDTSAVDAAARRMLDEASGKA